jgi:hypothetical protein
VVSTGGDGGDWTIGGGVGDGSGGARKDVGYGELDVLITGGATGVAG